MTGGTQATIKLMSPEEISARAGGAAPPPLRLPAGATLFAERALRLRQLAAGHAMRDFLIFMADLAQAQQQVLARVGELPLPTASGIAAARAVGRPPLSAADWERDPAWHALLRELVDTLGPRAPAAVQPTLLALRAADADMLETQADCLLTGVMRGLDLAAAPLVAAALQVYWTALVQRTAARFDQPGQPAFALTEDETLCLCCASRPIASITRQVADVAGQRYLHCSLCASEWHMVRIQCPHCLSGLKLAYESLQALDGGAPANAAAVQAETCGDCGHYLKIMHTERDPFVEPLADDLASVTLDLLVSETGLRRHGVNLMLLFGDPDGPPPDPPGSP